MLLKELLLDKLWSTNGFRVARSSFDNKQINWTQLSKLKSTLKLWKTWRHTEANRSSKKLRWMYLLNIWAQTKSNHWKPNSKKLTQISVDSLRLKNLKKLLIMPILIWRPKKSDQLLRRSITQTTTKLTTVNSLLPQSPRKNFWPKISWNQFSKALT